MQMQEPAYARMRIMAYMEYCSIIAWKELCSMEVLCINSLKKANPIQQPGNQINACDTTWNASYLASPQRCWYSISV
jgi:hypothetical protein